MQEDSMNFNNVVHYLASEFKKFERERLEWQIEKNALLDKIAVMEGEKRALQHLNKDMHNKLVLSTGKIEKPNINIIKKKEETRQLLYNFMREAKQLATTPFEQQNERSNETLIESYPKSYYNMEELDDLATIKVEDLKKEKRSWRSSLNYRSHFDVVRSVLFIDHYHFLSLGDDGCAKVWNLKSEDPFRCFRAASPLISGTIMSTALYGSENVAICGDLVGRLHMFKIDTSRPVEDYPNYDKSFRLFENKEHTDSIWDIASFDKQSKFVSVSSDTSVRLWDLKASGISHLHSITSSYILI
eukprot:NODE_291_length_11621_cov_0.390557.p5 type:complete len:301 gc:universal NODE_291_length_11621_cov_0.390557:2330-3232(+)